MRRAISTIGKHRKSNGRATARRVVAALGAASLAVVALIATGGATAVASSAASFTSVDETFDGAGHCLSGNPAVNCNTYDDSQHVWLNGGPIGAQLGAGDYFFAVIAPGGQADPNEGAPKLLSSDATSERTFHANGDGTITYAGSHDIDGTKIRLAPFADTPNGGGVYVLAICSLAGGVPVAGGDCKYDSFKIRTSDTTAAVLTVTKDAAGSYTDTYHWTIGKTVDKTVVKKVGGTATFAYTVSVGHDSGVVSDVAVTGTIVVINPNAPQPVAGVNVSDTLSDGTPCAVTGGTGTTVTDFATSFAYSCSLAGLPSAALDNTVTVTWPKQTLGDNSALAAGTADFTFTAIGFTATTVDDCATVTDTVTGSLGQLCATDPSPATFQYNRTVPVPAADCVSYGNTASYTTGTTGTTGSASQSVSVCGPHKSGARTIGFWSNKNGQSIITGQAKSGPCGSAAWLRTFAPFQDLGVGATCSQVAAYVAGVIKAASAAGSSMNPMLKAQMLATALDVYFSDPTLGGNKLAAPAPIGDFAVDLTAICTDIGTCGSFIDTSVAFGGVSSATVATLLSAAAAQSNAGGTVWYGNSKPLQEKAKDTFDAINNEVAFSA